METFSFNPPENLTEEQKCLLAVTFFEATNSVFFKYSMKKVVFQFQHQFIGTPKMLKNLLTS